MIHELIISTLSLSVGLFVCSTDCLFVCLSLPDYIFASLSLSLSTYLSLFLDFTELFHSANYTAILAIQPHFWSFIRHQRPGTGLGVVSRPKRSNY